MLRMHVAFSHITLVFLTLWSCAWNHFIELQEPVLLVLVWYKLEA